MAPKVLLSPSQKILEDCGVSGELFLCGRKLKEFPKVAPTGTGTRQLSLEDTVIAGKLAVG